MLRTEIKGCLTKLDSSTEYFNEHTIAGKIREIVKKEDKRSLEDDAEIFAFNVYTDETNSTAWGSYFGPMMSFPDTNGNNVDFPSRDTLNEKILEYWKERFEESKHTFLKTRYADLLIEFSNYSTDKVTVDIFQKAIDGHIALSQQEAEKDISARNHLNRSLTLSRKYNQTKKIEGLFDEALKLENEIAIDDKPGFWGFVLEWFLLDPKFSTTEEKEKSYITDFENRRQKLLKSESIRSLENATIQLAKYHKHKSNFTEIERILGEYEDCIRNYKEFTESSFGRHHYLQNLEEIYIGFNLSEELNKRLATIRGELRNFRLDPDDPNFKTISVTQDIPQEKIDQLLNGVFESKDITQIIIKIVVNFFLRQERETERFNELNSKYVFAKITSGAIFDEEKRFIANLPPLDEAPDLHFTKHCTDNLHINSMFLSLIITKLVDEYKKDELVDQIKKSGLISEADHVVLEELLDLFWKRKYLAFIHIAVPFTESTLRRLLLTSGMVVSVENQIGGYDYKSINSLLEHEQAMIVFKHIFQDVGDDLLYTVRLIFTEKLGLNIRNRVAHGIYQSDFVNEKHSNHILFIIFMLSLIKIKE